MSTNSVNKDDLIKGFWQSQAETHGTSASASWGDNYMIDLEIDLISTYLKDGDKVLDVGCANGHATFIQHKNHDLASIDGVDYAENMIAQAQIAKQELGLGADIKFADGDVRALTFEDNSFDVVYTTRVLINLPTWAEQKQGIDECLRVVKAGGTVVLCEGFREPMDLLNAMRTLKDLPPLVEHEFNKYLGLADTKAYVRDLGHQFDVIDFSSIYYLGSRFLRELVTNPNDYPGYSNPINGIFHSIEQQFSGGGFGIQQAVIIKPT